MPPTKSSRPPARLSHLTLAKLVQLLLTKPASVSDMEEWTGLRRDTLYRFMKAMRAQRVAHVSGWDLDSLGRATVPIFKLGVGDDAPRGKGCA